MFRFIAEKCNSAFQAGILDITTFLVIQNYSFGVITGFISAKTVGGVDPN
jgi:hypothetical protein